MLIDDAYNSSPEALNEALTLLRSIAGGSRRFAVIGDMLELGAAAEGLHHAAGRHAAACATHLFAFGRYSDAIAEGAEEGGMPCECIRRFPDADACTAALLPILSDGDAVLVKASHAMGGKHICEAIRRRAIRPGGTVCKKQKG